MENENHFGSYGMSGTLANSASLGAVETKKQSEFDREGEILNINVQLLFKSLETLESRMSGILRPQLPQPENAEKVGTVAHTNLGQFVKEKGNQIERVNKIISDLIFRIEI